MSQSSNFVEVNEFYGIDGSVSNDQLKFLTEKYKSALYLCPDSETDKGAENGFSSILGSFPNAKHVTLDPNSVEYSANDPKALLAVQSYKKFESALKSLPTPTVVICKSARRASAVVIAYLIASGAISKEEGNALALRKALSYTGSAGLSGWVDTVTDDATQSRNNLIFRQLFEKESSTYTYLLADEVTKEAILIDPVLETVARDAQLVQELGLTLKYVLNTHIHADHITGSGKLKQQFAGTQSIVSVLCEGAASDLKVADFEKVSFGSRAIYAVSTPGHTAGCTSYVLDDLSAVFTGDTMLIRGCGRTDFQGGSAATLYKSIHTRLFTLPDSTFVYPAHDYKGLPHSTIGEEKKYNPRATKTEEQFIEIMNNLNLPRPKKIDEAVPANLVCGLY